MTGRTMVIAFASAKGGAGKTVTAASVGLMLAAMGRPTLLIDCDAATNGLTLVFLDEVNRAKSRAVPTPVWIQDVADGEELTSGLDGHTSSVSSLALGSLTKGNVLVSAGADGKVHVWSIPDFSLLRTLHAHQGPVSSVAISPFGQWFATGGADGTVRVWKASDYSLQFSLDRGGGPVSGVAVSRDNELLASCDVDGLVHLWNTRDGSLRAILTGHSGPVYGVAIGANGAWLASAGSDRTVRLWSAEGGTAYNCLAAHDGPVTAVVTFPTGPTVASAGIDGCVHLWNGLDGSHQGVLTGHEGTVNAVALNQNGSWITSAGSDGTVRLWRSANGEPITMLRTRAARVSAVAQTRINGRDVVIAGSGDDHALLGAFDVGAGTVPRPLPVRPNLDVIPATYVMHHTGGVDADAFEKVLEHTLRRYRADYDFIIIDAQPGADAYALAAGRLADRAVIVSEMDAWSFDGVERLQRLADGTYSPDRAWVLVTKVLPDHLNDVETSLQRTRHLPPIPFDPEVVQAGFQGKLALNLEHPNAFTLAVARASRALVGGDARVTLHEWLAAQDAAEKARREEELRRTEHERAADERTHRFETLGTVVAAAALGVLLSAVAAVVYLSVEASPVDGTLLRLVAGAIAGLAALTGIVAVAILWRPRR